MIFTGGKIRYQVKSDRKPASINIVISTLIDLSFWKINRCPLFKINKQVCTPFQNKQTGTKMYDISNQILCMFLKLILLLPLSSFQFIYFFISISGRISTSWHLWRHSFSVSAVSNFSSKIMETLFANAMACNLFDSNLCMHWSLAILHYSLRHLPHFL